MPSRAAMVALVAVVVVLAVAVPPALAAPPPTLTGQVFGGDYYGAVPSDMSLSCVENSDGTTTLAWITDNETGQMRIRRNPAPNFGMDILALHAEFAVQKATGQVTGTKDLAAPVTDVDEAIALCEFQSFIVNIPPINVPYKATITTPEGVFTDRGTASHRFDDQGPNPGSPTQLREVLTSSLAATEQQHSVLFGKRTPGSSLSAIGADTKQASPFTFYFPGTVRRLHAFIDGKGATSGSQTLRAVLYRNGAQGPGAYVTRSFEFTVPAGMSARWVPFYLAPTAQLQPGVYWLGLQAAGTSGIARYSWDNVASSRRFNVDSFADGASDPFGTSFSDNQQLSIFAFGSY